MVSGGTDGGATIASGGTEFVSSGGFAIFAMVQNDGLGPAAGGLVVFGAGTSEQAVVFSNSQEAILSGGTASAASVLSGGVELVFSGGTDIGTTVSAGGQLDVGIIVSGVVSSAGGTAIDEQIQAGGTETVFSGGTDISATVRADGTMLVSSGATVVAPTIDSGGEILVLSGGTGDIQRWVRPRHFPSSRRHRDADVRRLSAPAGRSEWAHC